MKRILAILMSLAVLISEMAAFAEGPEVFSYDFELKFHLDADAFPVTQRQTMKGYGELLDALTFRGNLTFCPKTKSTDMEITLVPDADPKAAISFHMKGLPYWWSITSSLFGEEETSVCFQPENLMAFAARSKEFYNIPLAPLALLVPQTTVEAIDDLEDLWEDEAGRPERQDPAGYLPVPYETLQRIADGWQNLFSLPGNKVYSWINALAMPLPQYEEILNEMQMIPDLLLQTAAGGYLTLYKDGNWERCRTDEDVDIAGEYKDRETGDYEYFLQLPPIGGYYLPSFDYQYRHEETGISISLEAAWERLPMIYAEDEYGEYDEEGYDGDEYGGEYGETGDEGYGDDEDEGMLPDTLIRISAAAEGLPEAFPSDSAFTGQADIEGILLPNPHLRMKAETKADGNLRIEIREAEKEDGEPVFTCTGTIVRVPRTEPLEYFVADIHNEYNLFALDDQSLNSLLGRIKEPILNGVMDFVYAIPVSGCQSILDTLEEYGLVQVLLR